MRRAPRFELTAPGTAIRVKIEADGYLSVEFPLSADDLETPGKSARGWVVSLRRGS